MCAARYMVTRKIADGGMAELYLGVQRGAAGFERPIVIKRVRAAFCADPATREALVDEAHVAMSLNHSNIVQVLDLGFAAGRYFLVLELVDGWDLSVLLDRAAQVFHPMPPELAMHLSAEICRALAFAHGKTKDGLPLHIVHRDVNPHNVLVSEQGEVKLTDFGIATGRTRRRARTTLQGEVKGKLGFMSPEQVKGDVELDARSDIFSLGCTLYLLATGLPPFEGGTELEMLLRMEHCAFRPAEEARPGLPPELTAILRKAMKEDPRDRYANAEAMLHDLERVQRGAFRPAGQTELKAWLAELARRDKVPTISRRPGGGHAGQGELEPGSTLVLEEIESDPGAINRVLSPKDAIQPPPLPTVFVAAPKPEPIPDPILAALKPDPKPSEPPKPEPIAPPKPLERKPTPQPKPAERKPTPAAMPQSKPEPKPAEKKPTPPAVPLTKPLERTPTPAAMPLSKPVERKPTPAAATPLSKPVERKPTPAAAAAKPPPLRAVDPPALPRIIISAGIFLTLICVALAVTVFVARPKNPPAAAGPDSGTAAAVMAPDTGEERASDDEIAYPPLPPDQVNVPVDTTPAGAIVFLNGRATAGTTPLTLKLKPGRNYDLRIEKPGFRVAVRTLPVTAGKKVHVTVTLEKLPK